MENQNAVATMLGRIDAFNPTKNFGWVVGPDRKTYWFHRNAVADRIRLYPNDTVSFQLAEGRNGRPIQAVNIVLVYEAATNGR
jgi:cold shock CspA family protein